MASHGKVFDLFDDRYLDLQDVVGNVEPLPTLVPYEQYKQHLITYRMDTSHEVFLALLQDFTERKAIETGKELWTWYVQWGVDEAATNQSTAVPHSPKKPRLDLGKPNLPNAQPSQRKAGLITAQARVLDPELMHEEDMLRILVDIVQVNSAVVPNFIEFLYRWIDFYEGDGKALKAALRREIPSLWDFEYHPIVVPEDVKKKVHEANGGTKDENSQMDNKTPKRSDAEELAQSSPTKKMRERPDLAALERKAEESERLQYREVHFGIQPPKLNEPLPPLINIPRDPQKRSKYYAACFKSRQRAFYMLMEAGVTPQHMRDYKRGQRENVKDTPFVEGDGLRNYEQDAQTAQKVFLEKEKCMKKQMEIAISTRLAEEVQAADRLIVPEGASGVPLVPATPAHAHANRLDMARQMLRKIQHTRDEIGQRINIVPTPLVGKMKSKLFERAKDREAVLGPLGGSPVLPTPVPPTPRPPVVDPRFEPFGGSSDEDSDDEGGNGSNRMRLPSRPPLPPPPNLPRPSLPSLAHNLGPNQAHLAFDSSIGSSNLQQNMPDHIGFLSPATSPRRSPTQPRIADYMRNLTPEQAQQLLSQLNQHSSQLPATGSGVLVAGGQDAQDGGSLEPLPDSILRPSNPLAGLGQTPRFSLPVLAPSRTPAITISPPHAPNGSQHQAPRGFGGGYNPFTVQPPAALANPHTSSSSTSDHSLLPRALNVAGSTNGVSLYPAMHGTAQHAPPQQSPPSAQPQPYNYPPNLPQQAQELSYTIAPGLTAPNPPPAFAQRLLATQQEQGNSVSGQGLQQPGPSALANRGTYAPNDADGQLTASQPQRDPRPPIPRLTLPRPGMQRSAPSPLNLLAPPSPLSSLAPSLLSTSPLAITRHGIPLQIYFPKLLVPGNTIGPGGAKLGDGGSAETDAFLLGHAHLGSGKITLNKAVFLPVGVWQNAVERVRKGKYNVLESYPAPGPSMPNHTTGLPHRAAYKKMKEVYGFMVSAPPAKRERELTKRWRVSKGRMTASERGAVWEGWGVEVDREVSLSREERSGAVLHDRIIYGESEADKERERRRREIEEMLEEEEEEEEEEALEDMDMEMQV